MIKTFLKVGFTVSGIALMVADSRFRRAAIGAVSIAAEGVEKGFDKLVQRGMKASQKA